MSEPGRLIVTLTPSPVRRTVAACTQGVTGIVLIWLGLTAPQPAPVWQLMLIGLGAGALWAATRLWQATAQRLELTETDLRSSDGTVLCALEDVASIDRGAFAFKPSNGFLLRLSRPTGPRFWAPGLWWRTRSRIGVGGVTPSAQGKIMAELIAHHIATRDS
jgi:hypothetical protein